jgi:uncharacterized protein
MTTSSAILVLLLSLNMTAVGQERPTVAAQPNTVFAGADGKFETAPDTTVLSFNISADADKAKAAYDLAAQQAEQTRQILRANGIDPKAAEIGYYSLQPQYAWISGKGRLRGYRVTTTVSLKLKDFSKIAPLTEQLADASVGTGQSLGYTLENIDEAKSKAVEDAYRHARLSAEAVARTSGRTLGELSYASVDTFENPRIVVPLARTSNMRASAAVAAPTEEFTPQNVTVTAHVNAMFGLK